MSSKTEFKYSNLRQHKSNRLDTNNKDQQGLLGYGSYKVSKYCFISDVDLG